MAVTFQAAGTRAVGIGDVSPAWPAHVSGDIGILLCETANEAVTEATAGWTELTSSPQGTGTAGAAAATRLTAWWKRAASSSEGAATVTGATDHKNAQIVTFRGCATSLNPWDVMNGGVDSTTQTSFSAAGPISTLDECLVAYFVTVDTDIATARWSSEANSSLTSIVERVDQCDVTGNGGGLMVTTGYKAIAGDTGTFTATAATATTKGWIAVAFRPQLGVTQPAGAGTTIYIYDNASAANGTNFTFAEIATAFPADFIDSGTTSVKSYRSKVMLQVGDAGTGTKATTLTATLARVDFDFGATLVYRGSQISSWSTKYGTKVGSGTTAGGKDGVTISCGNTVNLRGNLSIYDSTILSVNSAGRFGIFNTAETQEFIDCLLGTTLSGNTTLPVRLGATSGTETGPVTNIYNCVVVCGDTAVAGVLASYNVTTCARLTFVAAAPTSFLNSSDSNLVLKDIQMVGSPTQSDIRGQGTAGNWSIVRPLWSGAAKMSGAAMPALANSHKEMWLYDAKVVDKAGAPIASVAVTLTDSLSNQVFAQLTGSEGRVTFGSGLTANAVTVMDHYGVSGVYTTRSRSPFTLEVNTAAAAAAAGGSVNASYGSRVSIFDWPGLSTGNFSDVMDTVEIQTIGPGAHFCGSPLSGVGPLTVSFSDDSSAGDSPISSWSWTFGDGATSSLQNPTNTYASPGTYSVSLTVTTAVGSSTKTRTNYVTVIGLSPPTWQECFLS